MPGYDLRVALYYTKTNESPILNQLFAALYDLILCRITKMSSLAPSPGRTLDAIFDEKIPKINPADEKEREKFVVSPELIAYLKWLIYTAAFKDPNAGDRGAIHARFYVDWVSEIVTVEKREATARSYRSSCRFGMESTARRARNVAAILLNQIFHICHLELQ